MAGSRTSAVWVCLAAGLVAAAHWGCGRTHAALTDLVEARRLSADLRVQFTNAVEASNRAVMADTDDASEAAAREARQATEAAVRDIEALRPLLRSLGYTDEQGSLDTFIHRFAQYRRLDAQILPLAVENTNLKAQRLLFGPAQEASDAFEAALDAAAHAVRPVDARRLDAQDRARIAVLRIQVLLARHIAEVDDAAMTTMEGQMSELEGAARSALGQLGAHSVTAASPSLAAAAAALDRFAGVKAEIVALSRRNTNVRSLALSLGQKRAIVVQCDEQLRALEAAIQKHEFTATR